MPKIYDQKQDPEKEPLQRSQLGGDPGAPERTQKPGMVLAIIVVLALVILLLVYRVARGAEAPEVIAQIIPATISSLYRA